MFTYHITRDDNSLPRQLLMLYHVHCVAFTDLRLLEVYDTFKCTIIDLILWILNEHTSSSGCVNCLSPPFELFGTTEMLNKTQEYFDWKENNLSHEVI